MLSNKERKHWELIIANRNTSNKLFMFIHASEHAYETFSSYSMEAIVEYLLSNSAEDAGNRFVFVIHLMTIVDGVANGYEYRAGYGYPDSRGTNSARLLFDTIDKLKPDYVLLGTIGLPRVKWITLSYTDSRDGKATRRGWYLFTQHFPSPDPLNIYGKT